MTNTELLVHAAIAVVVLVCYTVLTALGHDGTLLLGVLVGQGVTVGATKAIAKEA